VGNRHQFAFLVEKRYQEFGVLRRILIQPGKGS
jgi:hypothetical protein